MLPSISSVVRLEVGAARAVEALVDALVDVARVVDALEDLLHLRVVARVGGADEEVVRRVDERRHVLEPLRVLVGELARADAELLRGERDGLPVLVGAGEEEHVLATLAHVPCEHVGGDRRVRVAEVRLAVHVVDRGGYVVAHVLPMLRTRRGRAPEARGFHHRMGGQRRTVEEICDAIASRNYGIVTRAELVGAGVTAREIERRRERGYLLSEFRGVFRVGHRAPSDEARYMAAVKACGEGARLSGPAAGYLYGLTRASAPIPHVTAPRERRVKGVVTKRSRVIETAVHCGIPITTVARTLLDLASTLSLGDLARACHEAGVKYGTTPSRVEEVLARHPNAPGGRKLRRILHGDVPVTQSALESRLLRLLLDHGLPLPVTNKPTGTFRVDCRWPDVALTVELDGYRYHSSRHAWEKDRRREREARARGDEFRRYTYGDVYEDSRYMLRELSSFLRKRAA